MHVSVCMYVTEVAGISYVNLMLKKAGYSPTKICSPMPDEVCSTVNMSSFYAVENNFFKKFFKNNS